MKKFLLASACLLTLTACGQGQEAKKQLLLLPATKPLKAKQTR